MMSVMYSCGCGRRYPLGELYWSDTCKKIVCPWPSCSLQEIDSFFCRYQMDNLPSKEAAAYKNRSARTFSCPDCKSTLQTIKDDEKYLFFCIHCRWDSETMLTDEDPDTLMMVANAREREENVFDILLSHYQQKSQTTAQVQTSKRSSSIAYSRVSKRSSTLLRLSSFNKPQFGWKMEHLEAKLRENELNSPAFVDVDLERKCATKFPQHGCFNTKQDEAVECAQTEDMSTVSTLAQRNLCTPLLQSRQVQNLYPSRPDLRVKRSWRCVESMSNGAPGILVKPQINPMTGDSSMVVAASWWKKATLGIHYIPNITIQRTWRHKEAWLLIENPMEEDIALVITSKSTEVKVVDEPVRVGAYEDPNLLDMSAHEIQAFINMTDSIKRSVLRSRNYVKLKLEATIDGSIPPFTLDIQMYHIEDDTEELKLDTMQPLCAFGVTLNIPMDGNME